LRHRGRRRQIVELGTILLRKLLNDLVRSASWLWRLLREERQRQRD